MSVAERVLGSTSSIRPAARPHPLSAPLLVLHPVVCVFDVLPGLGVISEVLPVFRPQALFWLPMGGAFQYGHRARRLPRGPIICFTSGMADALRICSFVFSTMLVAIPRVCSFSVGCATVWKVNCPRIRRRPFFVFGAYLGVPHWRRDRADYWGAISTDHASATATGSMGHFAADVPAVTSSVL